MTYPPPARPTGKVLGDVGHTDDHNAEGSAINDIVAELGTKPRGAFSDLTARLSEIEARLTALESSGSTFVTAVDAKAPASHYRFGESGGTEATDRVGTRHGVYEGAVSLGVAGLVTGDSDTAVRLDGTGPYIRLDELAPLLQQVATDGLSFGLLVNVDEGTTGDQHFISAHEAAGGNRFFWRIRESGAVAVSVHNGSSLTTFESTNTLEKGVPHYVGLTIHPDGSIAAYVDHVEMVTGSQVPSWADVSLVSIGQDYDAGPVVSEPATETVDELMVFTKPLSELDHSELATAAGIEAPAAPTSAPTLSSTVLSSAEIDHSWTEVADASYYEVEENGVLVATVTGLTLRRTGLEASTTYETVVYPVNAGGRGPVSNTTSRTTNADSNDSWDVAFAAGGATLREWFFKTTNPNIGPQIAVDYANPITSNRTIKNQADADALSGKYLEAYVTISLDDPTTPVTVQNFHIKKGSNFLFRPGTNGGKVIIKYAILDGLYGCDILVNTEADIFYCELTGAEDAIRIKSGCTYEYNLIHTMRRDNKTDPHADGMQLTSGSAVAIRRSYIDVPHAGHNTTIGNAAVHTKPSSGNISDVTIDENYLNGGNYTVYFDEYVKLADGIERYPTLCTLTNNRFGRDYSEGLVVDKTSDVLTRSGNIWDDDGTAIPGG